MAKRTSRGRMRVLRRLVGWPLAILLALVAFTLGFIGFTTAIGDRRSLTDVAYLSLQLFTVESGNQAGPSPPVTLEIARLLAPATTAYAVGLGLLRWFRHELELRKLRRQADHIVVIGLGWLGSSLVERLDEEGRRVVAVSLDGAHPAIVTLRRAGVPVVIGDGRDADVLQEARAERASSVVIFAGADETSAETALAVRDVFRRLGSGELTTVAHIRDPDLCSLLRTEALAEQRDDGFRLEFFNVADEAAAIMLDEYAAFITEDRPVRIGIVGGNDIGRSLIAEGARIRRQSTERPLHVVFAGPEDVPDRLTARHPYLTQCATFDSVPGPPDLLTEESIAELGGCDAVFVCLDEDTAAIAVTLTVAERIRSVPVVVSLGDWTGLASMLADGTRTGRSIHPFLVHQRALDSDLLLAGIGERIARAIHTTYVRNRRLDDPRPDPGDPALAEWRELDEQYRASNRAQAAHIGVKLRRIGCGLAPLDDWDAPQATLSDAEVEVLAELEHDRFVRERRGAGWRSGRRGPRSSPVLVSWAELDGLEDAAGEPIGTQAKERTRQAVRALPSQLALAGYRLVRRSMSADDVRP